MVSGRRLLALVLLVSLAALIAVQPLAAFRPLGWLFPGIVWRVDTDRPLAALSFDDGPDPVYTPQVLALLERHGARATFFLLGERAASRPDLLERLRREGHEIGNHYYPAGSALPHSTPLFGQHLARAERALGLQTADRKLFRPPGGLLWPSQLRLVRERGYTCVLGSAYPYDPQRPPAAYIRWLVVKNLAPGVIVILHDAGGERSNTLAALPGILSAASTKGLRLVSVGELLDAARR